MKTPRLFALVAAVALVCAWTVREVLAQAPTLTIQSVTRVHPAPCDHYSVVFDVNGFTLTRVYSREELRTRWNAKTTAEKRQFAADIAEHVLMLRILTDATLTGPVQ